ncbi:site-specific integrase [Thiohalorhabdus methylotrophus]|uniref:Site-specific integrase n=1 Tax=Thiohalorhabdus methylotrophus TaxID=3242694 RepID=A0ABV4U0W0_9GAMM
MASIRKRGNRWQVIVRRRGYPDQTQTFTKKPQAEQWARKIESEMDAGVWEDTSEAEETTLGEALERYRREVTPGKKSRVQESYRIGKLLGHKITERPLGKVRGMDVADYRDERLQEVGPDTVRLDLALLSNLYEVARKEWSIAGIANPVANIRMPRPSKGRDWRLQPGEEERILRAAAQAECPWIKPFIQLALETAMRRGELLRLRWDLVNLTTRAAHLPETKNGEARSVPLSTRALAVLQALPRSLDGRVIPLSDNAARLAWKRCIKRANREARNKGIPEIEDLRFHDLRHEATSRFFERTELGLMEIASVTGHKDLRMLKRYTHLRASDLAQKLG